jgi:hypothetical protein
LKVTSADSQRKRAGAADSDLGGPVYFEGRGGVPLARMFVDLRAQQVLGLAMSFEAVDLVVLMPPAAKIRW